MKPRILLFVSCLWILLAILKVDALYSQSVRYIHPVVIAGTNMNPDPLGYHWIYSDDSFSWDVYWAYHIANMGANYWSSEMQSRGKQYEATLASVFNINWQGGPVFHEIFFDSDNMCRQDLICDRNSGFGLSDWGYKALFRFMPKYFKKNAPDINIYFVPRFAGGYYGGMTDSNLRNTEFYTTGNTMNCTNTHYNGQLIYNSIILAASTYPYAPRMVNHEIGHTQGQDEHQLTNPLPYPTCNESWQNDNNIMSPFYSAGWDLTDDQKNSINTYIMNSSPNWPDMNVILY
jgi:hypothetical protein